jgi:hypothetical protein
MANPLEGYESVSERIEKFWILYPNGRTDPQLIFHDGTRYVVKTDLYRDVNDLIPFAADFAEEIRSSSNRFPLENCATSSIGRALHTGGLSKFSENANRPSFEEMRRVGLHVVEAPIGEVTMSVTEAKDPWSVSETIGEIGLAPDPDSSTPKCSHGYMLWKQGKSAKTGNPYSGWTCPNKDQSDQCKAIWL